MVSLLYTRDTVVDADVVLETKHFIYFYVGPLAILIWKS